MAFSRRQFFTQLGRTVAANLSSAYEEVLAAPLDNKGEDSSGTSLATWMRPPGAVPEPAFQTNCTRCTACQEACPYDSIRRLGPEFGDNAGTPAIIPEESPCYLCEDMPCITACEPAALLPMANNDVTMGTAVLNDSACYIAQGQPCDYCFVRCPLGRKAIAPGEGGLPVIDKIGCVGCGVCAYLCPADALRIDSKLAS